MSTLNMKKLLMAAVNLSDQLSTILTSYDLQEGQGEEVVSLLLQVLRSKINAGRQLPTKSNGQDFEDSGEGKVLFNTNVWPSLLEKLPEFFLSLAKDGRSPEEITKAALNATKAGRETCLAYFPEKKASSGM